MTQPPSDAHDHLDLEVLADLDEDLLPGPEAATHEAHLSTCAVCRERLGRIRATRAVLGSLPDHPMPEGVASRIDAALAAAPAATIVPFQAKRRWRAHPTAAGLGAAAAVAALVAALVIGRTSDHPSSDNAPATLAEGNGSRVSVLNDLPTSATGTNYTIAHLEGQVSTLLQPPSVEALSSPTSGSGPESSQPDGASSPGPSAAEDASIPASLSRLYGSTGALASCVLGLEEQAQIPIGAPLAIDFAKFKGAPAVVLVLPGLDVPGTYGAWIVGPNCNRSDVNLLHYELIPAPASSSPSPSPTPSG